MADSRPGGIEKIAHLFIAGSGAASLRARENSPMRWASPAAAPGNGNGHGAAAGNGKGNGQGGGTVRGLEPANPTAADNPSNNPQKAREGAFECAPAESGPAVAPGEPGVTAESPEATEAPAGASVQKSQTQVVLQSLLSRAKVSAVLSGHMGPLAGPAAELFAKTLAREGTSVAMLYGPADFACLHRFTASNAADGNDAISMVGENGDRHVEADPSTDKTPCDMLLLPDWVFQSDLWPMSRGVHSICLAYGAGSEGLMSAYGALKGLIARLGKPEEIFLLPFGCSEQEETWTHERLADMCRRFLELGPRLAHEKPDMRVHASRLMPIDGGSEGVRQLFAAIGQPMLTLVSRRREPEPVSELDRGDKTEGPVMADRELQNMDVSADITPLVPVAEVPSDGEAVLRALIESRQADGGGFFDLWSRNGVAGTILGNEGLIGAAGQIRDLLGFALWMCRQAKINQLDELTSITITVRQPEEWLIEASRAMPVPVRWVSWRAFQLGGQLGLGFEPVEPS